MMYNDRQTLFTILVSFLDLLCSIRVHLLAVEVTVFEIIPLEINLLDKLF